MKTQPKVKPFTLRSASRTAELLDLELSARTDLDQLGRESRRSGRSWSEEQHIANVSQRRRLAGLLARLDNLLDGVCRRCHESADSGQSLCRDCDYETADHHQDAQDARCDAAYSAWKDGY